MKVLYIGGTGQISFDCIHESVRAGHDVYVYNRGNTNEGLPEAVTFLTGDVFDDETYFKLARHKFNVVCQFRLFDVPALERDLELFSGNCDQYVFISTASAYQKPVRYHVITEAVPLENPYWEYSRKKAAMEAVLQGQNALPYTIVRPSHTARTSFTNSLGDGDSSAHRMLAGKPILVPGDGTNVWTITHAADFAPPFVKLLGNDAALGDHFHLTSSNAYMWNEIYLAVGRSLGVEPHLKHVTTETLVRYNPNWTGPLLGDKTWSVTFDNSKIKSVVGDFKCETSLDEFMSKVKPYFDARAASYQPDTAHEALIDRIIAEQERLAA